MIFQYTEMPDGGWPRPLLDVSVVDMDDLRYPCLVDSGAVNTLLPRWLADSAAVDLGGVEGRSLAVATSATEAAFVTVGLSAAGQRWEAEIGFCDPWPYAWGLLGHRSFFRYFTVTLRAADFEFEVERVES